ncbi:MAG: Na+/H+ antiporter subunit E [Emergencia sp.]
MKKRTWIAASVLLFAIWIFLSGRFEVKFLMYGAAASVLAGWIFAKINDEMGISIPAFIRYFFWLVKEIIKSAWDITKVVLSPKMNINPHLIEFDLDYGSDAAATMLANSITLTPGTVTVDIRDSKHFVVHALTDAAAEGLLEGTMQRKVAEVFKKK